MEHLRDVQLALRETLRVLMASKFVTDERGYWQTSSSLPPDRLAAVHAVVMPMQPAPLTTRDNLLTVLARKDLPHRTDELS